MSDNDIIIVKNKAHNIVNDEIVIIGQKCMDFTDAYVPPCKFSILGMYKVKTSSSLKTWRFKEIMK